MTLAGFVLDVHGALSAGELSHAFGGALALAYVADPRGTIDVDVNVFVPHDHLDVVLLALAPLALAPERDLDEVAPVAGIRLRGDRPYPLDLFLSLDERYAEIERRLVTHPFGADRTPLPFLSAEDLALFKLSFGRDKDWVDLRSMAVARPDLDVDYIERQLIGLRGPTMHPRMARLRQLVRGAPTQGNT